LPWLKAAILGVVEGGTDFGFAFRLDPLQHEIDVPGVERLSCGGNHRTVDTVAVRLSGRRSDGQESQQANE
jgi:hypothetical protein